MKPSPARRRAFGKSPSSQRGIATLAVTLILLAILTLIVLFSTNVSFFDQRTTTNENRAVATEQMAEYALNLSGEFLKANRAFIINNGTGGWFSSGTDRRWQRCPTGALATGHPCAAEADVTRRAAMWYYDNDPGTPAIEPLPYAGITGSASGALTGESQASTARFAGTTAVNALLCRIGYDVTDPANPSPRCEAIPTNSRDIAVTLIADVALTGESSVSTIKETWSSVSLRTPGIAIPLVASGLIEGLGNVQVVAAPNASLDLPGSGFAASMWSPRNIDIGKTGSCGGGGLGSVLTCERYAFAELNGVPREELKTTCATTNRCGCPSLPAAGSEGGFIKSLSGHSGGLRNETYDILDSDGGCGSPDIQFFPSQNGGSIPKDRDSDPTDDSLFEYAFNVDYVVDENASVVNSNCGISGTQNCAAFALIEEYGATVLPNCSSLGPSSTGIFYVTGNCDLPSAGSATNPVVVVVDGELRINGNLDFFGVLMARSNNNSQVVQATGNVKIFGSLLVEGNIDLTGSLDIVYDETAASGSCGSYCPIPPNVRFGRVSGSWLDNRVGI